MFNMGLWKTRLHQVIQDLEPSAISTDASKLTSAGMKRTGESSTDNQMIWPGGDTQYLLSQQQTNHMAYLMTRKPSSTASMRLRGEGA